MKNTNIILVEITSNSLVELINALDVLKQQSVTFRILEEKEERPAAELEFVNQKIGRKGLLVLELLNKGATYKTIAEKTAISIDGVRYYVKKIFKELQVNNARSAVNTYTDLGGFL